MKESDLWFVEKYTWLYGQDALRGSHTFEAQRDQPKKRVSFCCCSSGASEQTRGKPSNLLSCQNSISKILKLSVSHTRSSVFPLS